VLQQRGSINSTLLKAQVDQMPKRHGPCQESGEQWEGLGKRAEGRGEAAVDQLLK